MSPFQHGNVMQCIWCLKKLVIYNIKNKLENVNMFWYDLKL
jgi:hypothetical protein